MRRAGYVLFLVVIFGMPLMSDAELWNYSVIGPMTFEGSSLPAVVTGNIVIDDQLRNWYDGTPAPQPAPGLAYGFLIRQFSLYVGGLTFAGSATSIGQGRTALYMELNFSGSTFDMFEWGLEGTGTLYPNFGGYWSGYYSFYNSDGTPWPANQYSQLSPIIQLNALNSDSTGTLWLTRTGAAKNMKRGNPHKH